MSYRRRRSYRRERRRSEERRFEMAVYAAVFLVLLLSITGNINAQMTTLIGGIILLGSAFYQSQRRWRVNPMTWIGGIVLVLVALGFSQFALGINLTTFPLLVLGAVLAISFFTGDL